MWSPDEVPAGQSALNIGAGESDDHMNLAVASDGTLYAAVKTSYDTSPYAKMALLVRRPGGTWDPLYTVDSIGTRPIIELNEAQGTLVYLYTDPEAGGNILCKMTSIANIGFGVPSTVLIPGSSLNNTSGTHQIVAHDLVVIAADDNYVIHVPT